MKLVGLGAGWGGQVCLRACCKETQAALGHVVAGSHQDTHSPLCNGLSWSSMGWGTSGGPETAPLRCAGFPERLLGRKVWRRQEAGPPSPLPTPDGWAPLCPPPSWGNRGGSAAPPGAMGLATTPTPGWVLFLRLSPAASLGTMAIEIEHCPQPRLPYPIGKERLGRK